LELLDAGYRRALGLERTRAGRDHDNGRNDLRARIGLELPAAVVKFFQRRRHLTEMELRIERLDLFQQTVHQLLAGDDRQAGNVIDRLFRIKFGALTARTVEDIDQVAFEVEKTQFKHGK